MLENAQPGGGRDREAGTWASGSAVTLGSVAHSTFIPSNVTGSLTCSATSSGLSPVSQPSFTSEFPALSALAGELNQVLGPEMGAFSVLWGLRP